MILLVDSDPTVGTVLESAGYEVLAVPTATQAKARIADARPELVVLELALPDEDGLLVVSSLAELTNVPLIVCSARQSQTDRVLALKLGADDVISKPFDVDEFIERVRAVIRRAARAMAKGAPERAEIRVGELVIAPAAATVTLSGRHVHLSATEYRLLVALAERADEAVSHARLAELALRYEREACTDPGATLVIQNLVWRVRGKLRAISGDGPRILTVRGRGYLLSSTAP